MNKFLTKMHDVFGWNLTKNCKAETLTSKVVKEKEKDIRGLKKTNGIIKVMIQSGELNLKVVK